MEVDNSAVSGKGELAGISHPLEEETDQSTGCLCSL